MTLESLMISALSIVTLGLCTIVWWSLREYIKGDQNWKSSKDKQLIKHGEAISTIKSSLDTLELHVREIVRESEHRQQAKFKFIQDDLKALSKRLDIHSKKTLSDENLGKVIILEKKVDAIFSVIKKHKKP